jgi:hypothetical protein
MRFRDIGHALWVPFRTLTVSKGTIRTSPIGTETPPAGRAEPASRDRTSGTERKAIGGSTLNVMRGTLGTSPTGAKVPCAISHSRFYWAGRPNIRTICNILCGQ